MPVARPDLYPADWCELALSLKRHAEWTCEACGREAHGRALGVHHVDHDPTNNAAWNLTVLCTICHLAVHANPRYHPRGLLTRNLLPADAWVGWWERTLARYRKGVGKHPERYAGRPPLREVIAMYSGLSQRVYILTESRSCLRTPAGLQYHYTGFLRETREPIEFHRLCVDDELEHERRQKRDRPAPELELWSENAGKVLASIDCGPACPGNLVEVGPGSPGMLVFVCERCRATREIFAEEVAAIGYQRTLFEETR